MTHREIASGKTASVVERYRYGVSPLLAMLVALSILLFGFSAIMPAALADDASTSDGTSSGTDSGLTSTFTDDITDTDNLLGDKLSAVTDAIKTTKEQTGVSVRLMYLPSFGTKDKPEQWASDVLEAVAPDKNTVMLAVASNDGNLVVAVSSNSDEWLKKQKTVEALSDAAAKPLQNSGTPDWAGAATAMMDELVKERKTATSGSSVVAGVVVMGVALVVLVAIIGATMVIRRRMKRKVMAMAAERRKAAAESGDETEDGEERLSRREIRMRRKAGMWKQ